MYTIYTDGAYSLLNKQGGSAFVIVKDDKIILEYFKTYKGGTNNSAELCAIILACYAIKNPVDKVIILSDSAYCIYTITQNWKREKNIKLWEKFDEAKIYLESLCNNIEFKWIKGHSTDIYNNRADFLANLASKSI